MLSTHGFWSILNVPRAELLAKQLIGWQKMDALGIFPEASDALGARIILVAEMAKIWIFKQRSNDRRFFYCIWDCCHVLAMGIGSQSLLRYILALVKEKVSVLRLKARKRPWESN